MDRVERNMDAQGHNAFSLFQTAITLEGRVSERTGELTRLNQRLMHEIAQRRETERALLLAKAEADRANLGKTQFLAAAGHDLHQPLNAARLFLGALTAELAAGRPRELAGRIETALDTVTGLIDALLEISRLDTGAWPVSLASFPVASIFSRVADEYAPQAAACGLTLKVIPSSLHVNTDRGLFQRALGNLVSNAIRYTRRGTILIGCRRRGGRVVVEVWDTGIGIADAMRPFIFEEFRQVGTPPRSEDKGFGLGLAIVERIARLLAIDISVRSRPGLGSCFALSVARGSREVAAPEPVTAPMQGPANAFAALCVACIDADPSSAEALATLLESWGCRVVTATGGDAALTGLAAEFGGPDLIIVDYQLDGSCTGPDTVIALRREFGRNIPSIIVCATRTTALRDEVESAGFGFLVKPLQPARLRAMMGHVLDQEPVG